jgi:hypothetical protein
MACQETYQNQGMQRDAVDLSPPRNRSIGTFVVPIGLVAIVVANTLFVGLSLGRRDDKLDTVVDSVKEIKTEMYRRSDADKDREVVNVKLDGLERRVTILEAAREHHVAVVTAKVEKQEEDLLTRAGRWLTGKPH